MPWAVPASCSWPTRQCDPSAQCCQIITCSCRGRPGGSQTQRCHRQSPACRWAAASLAPSGRPWSAPPAPGPPRCTWAEHSDQPQPSRHRAAPHCCPQEKLREPKGQGRGSRKAQIRAYRGALCTEGYVATMLLQARCYGAGHTCLSPPHLHGSLGS